MSFRMKWNTGPIRILSLICLTLAFSGIPNLVSGAHEANASESEVRGRLIFWRISKVATPVLGRIEALPQRVGDSVKKGEIIAKIDTRQLQADLSIAQQGLKRARAGLVSAEAGLKVEQAEYNRIAKLKNSPAFSRARFEDATNQLEVAKANMQTAQALISESEATVAKRALDVKLATVKAPFDGIIIRQLLTIGGLVSSDDPHILVIVDNTAPEIEAEIQVDQVSALKPGTELQVALGSGKRQKARLRAILPADTAGAKTRRIRLDLLQTDKAYSDAVPVTIYLPES